ncbi:MAG: family 78 glycoside hydrolase catalytic domain [Acidobacteria bacterium]|nr:family 78 glycoside hydrolase catalytic domain [Acidobacteriota bacterium]
MGSGETAHIVYGGKPLGSGARAYWKVRVWDQKGAAPAWSAVARWSAGLLKAEDWKGKWIGQDEAAAPGGEGRVLPARQLRKEFEAAKRVRRAAVYVAGLGHYELYLNGAKVGDHVLSPGLTEYDKRVFYVTFDVTRQVLAGRNALGVMLGNGRYWAPRGKVPVAMRSYGYPKLRLELNLEYADGTTARVSSDESWKLSAEGPVRANNEFDGEDYDARMEMAGWTRAGFDDARWEAAGAVAAPKGALVAQMAEPMRVTETLRPVKLAQPRKGVWVFDLGQNMVGWCRLRVAGPKGATVRLRHAETLQPDGTLYAANLR